MNFRSLLLSILSPTFLLAGPNPNILLITVDNLGYGDLSCYRSESRIVTPSLDRLASEGARLSEFYTASPTCTVSRACLLTGRVPQRHGLTNQLAGIEGNYGIGLSQDEVLIPQVLKQSPVPYITGCFGKWNIGFAAGSRPTERGFDEFIGHASGNMDYYHYQYRGKHDLYEGFNELHRDGTYASDLFADAAIQFIRRHSGKKTPWFCYLPFNAPHFPSALNKKSGQANIWQAPDRAFKPYPFGPDESDPEKRYWAVVTAVDEAIGRVLDALDEADAARETFIFFMSDNGAFRLGREGIDVGLNSPLRDGGITCWEGGIRVPAMARWPGKIDAGSVIAEPLWSPDLMIACASLADALLPENTTLDGTDPLKVLTGETTAPKRSLYFQFRNHAALRRGPWKIVRENPRDAWQLFQLKDDPGEIKNLADAHPERIQEMAQIFSNWLEVGR